MQSLQEFGLLPAKIVVTDHRKFASNVCLMHPIRAGTCPSSHPHCTSGHSPMPKLTPHMARDKWCCAETVLSPAQWDLMNTIRCSGETLLTLITDILDFSRIEADKMVLVPGEFHLQTVIEAAMEIAGLHAAQKRLQASQSILLLLSWTVCSMTLHCGPAPFVGYCNVRCCNLQSHGHRHAGMLTVCKLLLLCCCACDTHC